MHYCIFPGNANGLWKNQQNKNQKKYNTRTILVKFKDGLSKKQRADIIKSVKGKIKDKNKDGIDDRCKHIAGGNLAIIVLRDKNKKKDLAADAMAKLANNPGLVYVQYDYRVTIDAPPNDSRFSELWGLNNTGQTSGTADADIDAVEAWDITTGSSDVVVGVIDSGVNYTHPDLAANMWENPWEIPGNGIDDDGNGYIDDIHGINADKDNGGPMDDHNHGSHCAGTIGGVGNNGIGVTGVCWNVKIMGLKFIDYLGGGSNSDAIECINYAIDMKNKGVNIRILSNSWGGGPVEQALYDAIYEAQLNDIMFIAAAGNDTFDTDLYPHYPSSYDLDNIVSVAATNHNDGIAYFSNYGLTSVDLGAPGLDILSTLKTDTYGSFSGTSMATPHVAGAAALILSYNNDLTIPELKNILLDSGDPIAALDGKSVSGKRLNVNNALNAAPAPSPIFRLGVPEPYSQRVNQGQTAHYSIDIESVLGFSAPVDFTATAAPAMNAAIDFSPNPGIPGSAVVMNVNTNTGTAVGFYVITFTGTSGGITRSKSCKLEVIPEHVVSASYYNFNPVSIPDNVASGITSTIDFPDDLSIWKMSVNVNITHTWIGDLIVKLKSPAGTEVTLHDRTGAWVDNIYQTFYPTEFANESCKGIWTLSVSDNQGADVGTLDNWTIVIEGAPAGNINQSPVVSILSPANASIYTFGDSVTFNATATDDEDGDLTADIQWTSSRDGVIGNGPQVTVSNLSVGFHTITASVVDSGNKNGSDSIGITVNGINYLPPR